ncbi:MAG: UDP-N-acetylmuramoyl-tripeptide--D-alanyl-D-alanine ligase [Ruminococcaceae bacterium]|nr:UDP-N-acetylmuramoyl-tripeptide--D-alanyl-D-alanine ligase [Oscillospiraceae bacterium]
MIIGLSEKYDSRILAELCFGKTNCNVDIKSISIDSREVEDCTLFVAVRGENTDGHKYIDSAVKNGAVCVMCEELPDGFEGNYILVEDTVKAISDIATSCRERFGPFTVGVTGSVGKTTTKEFISYVLAEKYPTHKSGGNFNTVYGISLTLAALSSMHKAVVAEMGMSALGEISLLTNIARPDAAVITNIGTAHLEALGSRENIAKAKLEITEGLRENGTLVYNGDEPLLWDRRETFKNSISFGIKNEDADVFGYNVRSDGDKTYFDMRYKDEIHKNIALPTVGVHNVYNAMAAFSVGRLAGLSPDEIRRGLLNYRPSGMRQKIYDNNGYTIIEDCYNASPESMKASLSVLAELGKERRTVAVLGEMRELGKTSDELHKSVGRYAAELKIDRLYTYGDSALEIAVGALEEGLDEEAIIGYNKILEPEGLAEILKNDLKKGDIVLFKASRAVALEKVIELLVK